jgi:hypothetical protein
VYEVIAEPPLLAGAVKGTTACPGEEEATAVPIAGASATVDPAAAAPPIIFTQAIPLKYCGSPLSPQSVQYTIKPAAGVAIAFLCVAVIRGGSKPLVVEVTSNAADACGVIVPIPTWANVVKLVAITATNNVNFLIVFNLIVFILIGFNLIVFILIV